MSLSYDKIEEVIARLKKGSNGEPKRSIDDLPTPSLIVDRKVLASNGQKMLDRAKKYNVTLRPHIKTHKTIEGALYQLYGNDIKNATTKDFLERSCIVVSTLGEAEFFIDAGFQDVLYAVPIVPSKCKRLLQYAKNIRRVCFLVDSREGFEIAKKVAEEEKTTLHLYLDIDPGYHRTGIDTSGDEAVHFAKEIAEGPSTTLVGVYCHAGHSYHGGNREEIKSVAEDEVKVTASFKDKLIAAGLKVEAIAIGSTPTCSSDASLKGINEMHPGNYAFMDVTQAKIGSCEMEACACFVLARVVSRYRGDNPRLLIDAGALGLSKDLGPSHLEYKQWGVIQDHPNLKIVSISQEVGIVEGVDGKLDVEKYPIGTLLRITPNHSCLTAACYSKYYIMDEGCIVDEWKTAPRVW